MKPNKLFLLVFFILILCSYFVIATYNISYTCPNECVKNKTIAWNITIINKGSGDIDILYIKLIDSITKEAIAESEETELTISDPNAIDSNKSTVTTILPSETHLFMLNGTLPFPNDNNNLVYNLCLTQRMPLHVWGKAGSKVEYCYKDNYTIQMIDCVDDNDCDFNSYCLNNTCYVLNCTECQYIEEHECIGYRCCSDADCSLNEACIGNNCELLDCKDTIGVYNESAPEINETKDNESAIISYRQAHIVNHTCNFEPCKKGEVIINYTCLKADCNEDEFILDYACKKLNCSFYEGFVNHTCQKLNCKESEGIINHLCTKLECKDNEAIIRYKCTKINCSFFQKAESHNCLIHTELFIEFTLLAVIVFLFILDVMKYSGKYRKRLVSMLLKKAKERGGGIKKT